MSEVLKQPVIAGAAEAEGNAGEPAAWRSYVPAIVAVGGALVVSLLRWQMGGERFMSDVSLMMCALAAYLVAAAFYLLNLYAPSSLFQKIALVSATGGVLLNLSSWCVRWFHAYDAEVVHFVEQGLPPEQWPWAFRYVPFANLYDLSLAFAFGAGITTLLIGHRKNFRFIGAISLPLAALILVLARFIGSELIELPPVLDSYWRPIHVGIASLSYGVALVCFAVAVVYLLKDGVKPEAMAVWACLFALGVFATVGHFSVFWPSTFGTYRASTSFASARSSFPFLRADLPYVGWMLVAAGAVLAGVVVSFLVYLTRRDERARRVGHLLLRASLLVQAVAIVTLVYQVKNISDPLTRVDTRQYERHALWMVRRELEAQKVPAAEMQAEIERLRPQFYQLSDSWVQDNGSRLRLSLNANPVELAALITAFAATLFCVIFSFRTERLREALPPLDRIDSLMYKTAGVAFAGLALLLMTGAIWANESWGRYWGWDSKETGALVAWLTYGAYLHTRVSRGWTGRASAYFAIVAFLLVIFTYLGVSYLLPGLHSYA